MSDVIKNYNDIFPPPPIPARYEQRSPISAVFSENNANKMKKDINANAKEKAQHYWETRGIAAYHRLFNMIKADNTSCLRDLDVETISEIKYPMYCYKLIHWSAMWGSKMCLTNLIESFNEDPDDPHTNNGYSPIHLAAARKRVEIINILINHGASVHTRDKYGRTALHLAAAHNASYCIELLIKYGADIECQDKNLWTPILHAAFHGRVGCLETLVREGARTNVTDNEGNSPAHLAAMEGHLEALKFVIFNGEREIDEVFDSRNDYGQTPLLIAAQYYKENITNYLTDFENNILLHETRMDVNFPAHVAAFRGDMDALERLVLGGAVNVNQRDNHGYTLVHKAALKGNIQVIEWLEEKGAFLDIYTKQEETVDDIAARRGHHHLVEFLKKRREELNLREEVIITSTDGVSSVKLLGEQLTSAQMRAKERLLQLQKEIEITKSNLKQLRCAEYKDPNIREHHEFLRKIDELNAMLKLERDKRENLEITVTDQREALTKLEVELTNTIKEAEEKAQLAIAYLPRQTVYTDIKVPLKELKSGEGGIFVKKRTRSL